MTGATVGLYFLLATGVSALTIGALCVTGLVTALSRYLRAIRWWDKPVDG